MFKTKIRFVPAVRPSGVNFSNSVCILSETPILSWWRRFQMSLSPVQRMLTQSNTMQWKWSKISWVVSEDHCSLFTVQLAEIFQTYRFSNSSLNAMISILSSECRECKNWIHFSILFPGGESRTVDIDTIISIFRYLDITFQIIFQFLKTKKTTLN